VVKFHISFSKQENNLFKKTTKSSKEENNLFKKTTKAPLPPPSDALFARVSCASYVARNADDNKTRASDVTLVARDNHRLHVRIVAARGGRRPPRSVVRVARQLDLCNDRQAVLVGGGVGLDDLCRDRVHEGRADRFGVVEHQAGTGHDGHVHRARVSGAEGESGGHMRRGQRRIDVGGHGPWDGRRPVDDGLVVDGGGQRVQDRVRKCLRARDGWWSKEKEI